jgi:GTP-binding protein
VVNAYFAGASATRRPGAVFLLVDSRHPGLPADVEAHHRIGEMATPPIVIATKVDKLSRSERTTHLRELERIYHQPPIAVSVTSGDGIPELWRVIASTARGAQQDG